MRNCFFKYVQSLTLLLFTVGSLVIYNSSSETPTFTAVQTNLEVVDAGVDTSVYVTLPSDTSSKSVEIEVTEIEEEEEKNTSGNVPLPIIDFTSISFLPYLFSFNAQEKSTNLQRLFSFGHFANRRFVLFQSFRL